MSKRVLAALTVVSLFISLAPPIQAQELKSAKGTFTGNRVHQVRKKNANGTAGREELKKINKLSDAEKKGLTAEEIRELQENDVVFVEEAAEVKVPEAAKESEVGAALAKSEKSAIVQDCAILTDDISKLRFKLLEKDYENWGGLQERWVGNSNSEEQYFITPTGQFYKWDGSPQEAFTTGKLLATFPMEYYDDLSKIAEWNGEECPLIEVCATLSENIADRRFSIAERGDYYNWGSHEERWVIDQDRKWFMITKDGSFYRWNGSSARDFSLGSHVAIFPASAYNDLRQITNWEGQKCKDTATNDYAGRDGIIDDGSFGFTTDGKWKQFPLAGFEDDIAYSDEKGSKAKWTYRSMKKGTYEVYATWAPFPGATKKAEYVVQSGGDTVHTVKVDQTREPIGLYQYGHNWQHLGRVDVKKKKNLKVTLKHKKNEYAIADAVLVLPEGGGLVLPCAEVSEAQPFIDLGHVHENEECHGLANRGRVVALNTELNGGILSDPPKKPSFIDVPVDHQYYAYFEESGKEGWITGDDDCYGSKKCTARPDEDMTRAEFAHLTVRTFGLERLNLAPNFDDNPDGYYHDAVQTAADHCLLTPHPEGGILPHGTITFLEALNMFWILDRERLRWGEDCGTGGGGGNGDPETGNLYIGKSAVPIYHRQVLGGELSETLMSMDMRGEYEAIEVTEIQVNVAGLNRSIDRFELFREGETTAFASATQAACGAENAFGAIFCARMENQQLIVPNGEDIRVQTRALMKTDEAGAVSGDVFHTYIGTISARGMDSSNDLTLDNENGNTKEGEIIRTTGNIESLEMDVVLSKIVSMSNANTDVNGTPVPVGLTPAGVFRFTAAEHRNTHNGKNDVVIDSIIFDVDAENVLVNGANFSLYNLDDHTQKMNCISYDDNIAQQHAEATGHLSVFCTGIGDNGVNAEIEAGRDITLALEVDVTNPLIIGNQPNALQVRLQNFSDRSLTDFGIDASHFGWRDQDSGPFFGSFQWVEYPEAVIKSTFYGDSASKKLLEVNLADANPVGDTMPKGSHGTLMVLDATASCDNPVQIENLTVKHEGFGHSRDILGIYALVNGQRVTRVEPFDTEDHTADLRFATPVVVDACGTEQIAIAAELSDSAATSGEHRLVVELPSDVFSNATKTGGNFPLRGGTFRAAAVESGNIYIEYRSVQSEEVAPGDRQVPIGAFEVIVDSVEDQTLYSLMLEQVGSAEDGDFANIAIRRTDGTVMTKTVAQTVGDYVTLTFDPPLTILEGDKMIFEVIADIVGGTGKSISMQFEERVDLEGVGSLYGYGVNGQLYGSQVTFSGGLPPETVSVADGVVSITIDGPASQGYTPDDHDAVFANVNFTTGGATADYKSLFVLVQASDAIGTSWADGTKVHETIEDVELRNKQTGRTIDAVRLTGVNDSGTTPGQNGGTWQIYRLDDFIVRGTEAWELRADFIDNGAGNHPTHGDRFRVHICGEPTHVALGDALIANTAQCNFGGLITPTTAYQLEVFDVSTDLHFGEVTPRGTISGNSHYIGIATLTVSQKETGTVNSGVENQKDVNLLRFEARAGEEEDILFTRGIFDAESGDLHNIQNYALWVDTDNDGVVDTILEDGVAAQGDEVSFADLAGGGFVIPEEQTVAFEVHGDVSSSLVGNNTVQLKFATTAEGYLEAEELDDGSNLRGIHTNGVCEAGICQIIVATSDSTVWNFYPNGNLFVSKDSWPVRTHQHLAGTLGETALRLTFHADIEDIDVTDIQITSTGTANNSIDSLELFFKEENTPFAIATKGGCAADPKPDYGITFCTNMESRQLVVPRNSEVDIAVRPRLKNDAAGATIGTMKLTIDSSQRASIGGENPPYNGAVNARGDVSSNDLVQNDNDTLLEGEVFIGVEESGANKNIDGNEDRVVLSKIISIENANSDPNLTSIPDNFYPFAKFKFTAAQHNNTGNGPNDVIVDAIIFNVTATNVGIDATSFTFYNENDATKTVPCTVNVLGSNEPVESGTATGPLLVTCNRLDALPVMTEIDPGGSETFALMANITNTNIDGTTVSVLQAQLQNFEDPFKTVFGSANGQSHISWIDRDQSTNHSSLWVEYPSTSVSSTTYVD